MGQSIFQPIRFEVYPAAPRVRTSLSLLISKPRGTLHFNLGIQNFVSHPPPHTIGFFWAASINTFFFPFFIAPACSRVRYRRPIFCPSVRQSLPQSVCLTTFMSTFDIYVKVSILINYKTKQPSNLA